MADLASPRRIIDFYGTPQGVSAPGDSRLPAIRPATTPVGVAERGFTMGASSPPTIDVSARPVRPVGAPPQIGYNPARTAGAGIEGMGDFARGTASEISTVGGKGVGFRGALSKGAGALKAGVRGLVSGPALVTTALTPLARAQADATAGDNLTLGVGESDTVQGASGASYPRMFGASGTGLPAGKSVATGGSFRGGVSVMSREQVYTPMGGAQAAAAPLPGAPQAAVANTPNPRNTEAAFRKSQEGAYAPDLAYGGNVGYFSMDGAKPELIDAAATGRGYNQSRNGRVTGQSANSTDLVDSIVGRQAQSIAIEQEMQKLQAERANPAMPALKTADDFGGGTEGAIKAAGYNKGVKLQMEQQQLNQAAGIQREDLDLKRQKLAMDALQIPADIDYKQAGAGYYRTLGKAKLKEGDDALALAKLAQQKELKTSELEAKNNAPITKADAEMAATLAGATGLLPSEAATAVKAGYRTPQKAKRKWFGPDQQAGLVDAQGRVFDPSAPAGLRLIGTSGGKPVYEDANGNRVWG